MYPDLDTFMATLHLTMQVVVTAMWHHLRCLSASRNRREMLIQHYMANTCGRHDGKTFFLNLVAFFLYLQPIVLALILAVKLNTAAFEVLSRSI